MNDNRFAFWSFVLVLASALALAATQLVRPDDVMANFQEPPASCILDAARNGHWVCQTACTGWVTSKPPLYTWLAALIALPFDHTTRTMILAPTIASAVVLACLILRWGSRYFGATAGLLAALMFVFAPLTGRQMAIARTDALFSLLIAVTAMLAYRAWRTGRGWTWFWLAGAAATLAKGPLGLLLGAMGLVSALWAGRGRGEPRRTAWLQHGAGVALYLAIVVGWWMWAYLEMGDALVQKMLHRELLESISGDDESIFRQMFAPRHLVIPTLYLLGRFAPWSLLTCAAVWRTFRHPAENEEERLFERWLLAWMLGGLLVFTLALHQRPDLQYPLFAPAALLAGRELRRLLRKLSPARALTVCAAAAVFILLLSWTYYRFYPEREAERVRATAGMKAMAASIQARVGADFPLVYLQSSPYGLQFYLNTMTPFVSPDDAIALLSGSNAVFVVLSDGNLLAGGIFDILKIRRAMSGNPNFFELEHWPEEGPAVARLVSNRPRLEYADDMAFAFGHVMVRWTGMRMLPRRGERFTFRELRDGGRVEFTNTTEEPITLELRLVADAGERRDTFTLGPRETRRFPESRR